MRRMRSAKSKKTVDGLTTLGQESWEITSSVADMNLQCHFFIAEVDKCTDTKDLNAGTKVDTGAMSLQSKRT